MTWTVMKFGGTSLGSAERVDRVITLVRKVERPALVVSALGPTTDVLIEALDRATERDRLGAVVALDQVQALAHVVAGDPAIQAPIDVEPSGSTRSAGAVRVEAGASTLIDALMGELRQLLLGVSLLGEASAATRDSVMAYGERIAAMVIAGRMRAAGIPTVVVDARTWCRTDDSFGAATVDEAVSYAALAGQAPQWDDRVPVITGFTGATDDGRTTTLGRGGSDYTAALAANGLRARELQIWSDVPGVMTGDPDIVEDARTLARMTYGEALELAIFGAQVLHPRTLVPLLDSHIPMVVRSTLAPDDPGTVIDLAGSDDETRATSVTSLTDQALFDLRFRRLHQSPELGERIHRALEATTDQVWLVTHSAHGQAISAVVPQARAAAVKAELERVLAHELATEALEPIRVQTEVAVLTLVAEAMGRIPNVAGRLFGALGGVGINVLTIGQSATARSISCVVSHADLVTAVHTVHSAFHLMHQQASVLLLGTGVVGSALLAQIGEQRGPLLRDRDLELNLVGVATSSLLAFDARGLDPTDWPAQATSSAGPHGPVTPEVLDALARLPLPILVDCTAAGGLEGLYREAFARGIHVVAANKKPLTIETSAVEQLLGAARAAHRAYRHETTVGAALPVLGTLDDLVQTGDTVESIVGSLSGTLGYLCDQLGRGVPIDDAVRDAQARGYTEPRPQEDLSGTDAARKALILARRLGLTVEMDDVEIEPLVPAALLEIEDVEEFLVALADERAAVAARVDAARDRGEVLRYLVVIDPAADPILRVGPTTVARGHPAFPLTSSQSMVAFYTQRYATHPLVVSGAGAGGDVTASGVLADIIRIAVGVRGG